MNPRFNTVSFLSDYGLADEFVGVVTSVIRSIAPHAVVVNVTHDIPPHDLRAGAMALARAAQYLAPGVILAVVDPGVGTERRAVAVEVAGGEGVFVGPDNGLMASAVAMTGGAERVVELTDADYHLTSPGFTFAGRDVFAPVAAHLCNGVGLEELGRLVDPTGLLPGLVPVSRIEGDRTVTEVLWIDRFGNAQLNVGPDDIDLLVTRRFTLSNASATMVRTAEVAPTYAAIAPGGIGLVVDSYGLVSICLERHSAAAELGLGPGDEVSITPVVEEGRGREVPIRLQSSRGASS